MMVKIRGKKLGEKNSGTKVGKKSVEKIEGKNLNKNEENLWKRGEHFGRKKRKMMGKIREIKFEKIRGKIEGKNLDKNEEK